MSGLSGQSGQSGRSGQSGLSISYRVDKQIKLCTKRGILGDRVKSFSDINQTFISVYIPLTACK